MTKTQSMIAAERLLRRQDRDAATAQYEAAKVSQREKSARLRVLRLAKQAAEGKAVEKAAADRAAAKRKPRTKASVPRRGDRVVRV
jgi:hypothetical protein